jgi:hypothetical protein
MNRKWLTISPQPLKSLVPVKVQSLDDLFPQSMDSVTQSMRTYASRFLSDNGLMRYGNKIMDNLKRTKNGIPRIVDSQLYV